MKLTEMRAQVDAELGHIPEGPGEHQSLLRMSFNASRMHSLGRNATKEESATEVLQGCMESIRNRHSGARFCYDEEFFGCTGA